MQEWKEILDSIQITNNLSKCDILEQIKEDSKSKAEYLGTYKEWKRNNFDINHLFEIESAKLTLLHFIAINRHLEIVQYLISEGTEVNEEGTMDRLLYILLLDLAIQM